MLNRDIHARIAATFRGLSDGASFASLALLFLLATVYGFVHSAGPGHGKLLVASWFIAHGRRRDAVKMSAIIAIVHTGSAVLLATLFQVVLAASPSPETQETLRGIMTVFSGLVIIGAGVFRLIGHRHGEPVHAVAGQGASPVFVALAAGIVPCPLSMTLMLMSVAMGIYHAGLLAVGGISCGMFVLLVFVALFSSQASRRTERLFGGEAVRWHRIAVVISAILVIAFGVVVLLGGAAGSPGVI